MLGKALFVTKVNVRKSIICNQGKISVLREAFAETLKISFWGWKKKQTKKSRFPELSTSHYPKNIYLCSKSAVDIKTASHI